MQRATSRGGFTLIELMVVMLIILILVALTTAGISSVTESQNKAATERVIQQLDIALEKQWRSVISDARDSFRGQGLPPTELANWTVQQLNQEFPISTSPDHGALLYQLLSQTRRGGETFNIETMVGSDFIGDNAQGNPQLIDAWGNPLRLRWANSNNLLDGIIIFSAGSNEIPGDDDDITSDTLRAQA